MAPSSPSRTMPAELTQNVQRLPLLDQIVDQLVNPIGVADVGPQRARLMTQRLHFADESVGRLIVVLIDETPPWRLPPPS